jgi:hypothetical protein
MAPGLIAFAPARRSANRAVDKLAPAINQGLKSPDLNSRLGRLGAAAKSPQDFARLAGATQNQGAIATSSGMKARLTSRHPRSAQP